MAAGGAASGHAAYAREPAKADGERLFARVRAPAAARAQRVARLALKGLRRLRAGRRSRVVLALVAASCFCVVLAAWRGGGGMKGVFGERGSGAFLVDPLGVGAGDDRRSDGGAGKEVSEAKESGAVAGDGRTVGVSSRVGMDLGRAAAMQFAREEYGAQPMSMIVLFHNEYDSLIPVLESWIRGGLTEYVEEVIFFLNGVESDATFHEKVTAVRDKIPTGKVRVVAQSPNLPIGLAIKRMVEIAAHEYILLLEKDWELIEPRDVMVSRLQDSKILIGTGRAQLVRHRHRENPGVPIHALIMHYQREEAIMRQQPNLLCFAHHWQKDPTLVYPGDGIMRRCGGEGSLVEETDVFCTPARYCQWTNNPCVFQKGWFLNVLGNRYAKEYEAELAQHGPKSPFLDFEYYTNWRDWAWNGLNVTVATGAGLFAHAETEHRHFNTFWYAFYRLQTDLEDIRTNYLRNESNLKARGMHVDPSAPLPLSVMERYPVEFVRKYQVPYAFTGNLSSQVAMIAELYDPYREKYRVVYNAATDGPGGEKGGLLSFSKKSAKSVPWRQLITDIHFATEKAMMLAPPEQPHEMSITLISCLLNLDRHTVDRGFGMYMDAMQDWLTHEYNKVVYTTPDIADKLLEGMSNETKATTKFVYTSRTELRTKWMGPDNYDMVQEIRVKESWRSQASWLENSPQAQLEDYNPLVMSKMFMIREVARTNPWNTTHFLFLDAKHNCRNPRLITPRSDHIFRAHMLDKLLLTYFDYTPVTEVHGFEAKAFDGWVNLKSAERKEVKVGRGGVIGGSAFVIEALTAMYDVALTATLREGLMGTEENILSILMAQVPQYIDTFSNNWACKQNLKGDHKCDTPNSGYNCGIFIWAADGAPAPGAVLPSGPTNASLTLR